MANLKKEERSEMEHYLLAVGDFSNSYTKRSRANKNYASQEEYDISKLSLAIMYNDVKCYPEGSTYFDDLFQKAVLGRFPAFKFNGTVTEDFEDIPDPAKVVTEHWDTFVDIIRTMQYYKQNWRDELKPYGTVDYGLTVRHQRVFNSFSKFANLYSRSEKEYRQLIGCLYNRMTEYRKMVEPHPSLLNPHPSKVDEGFTGKNTNPDGSSIQEEEI
jgi:hypothetical protein